MEVQIYITRCKVCDLNTLLDKLEKFCHNRDIKDVDDANVLMNVSVYNSKHVTIDFMDMVSKRTTHTSFILKE